ncbi:MAG: hypothetical protein A2879_03345 [Omnitrophica WOR_2 bacterium RIFCSPHIGHO2_01_FULL_49_10]|nr:MAG: hypothetical protein A2879_03345 [Omnitrophica WOR_2 bacterium RIFCSPHIGHO2_01_FULL_49_10]OGX34104.1 MAG: hypothetical protein A3I43_05830 [Omnitrophica WOR_2 bacterium RIFCSPLOWO2_02_FULL_50_19]
MKGPDLNQIDVVILCGGKGERLKGVVKDRPKPMADISGRPFLDILIEHLRGCGFRRFILCAGYKGEMIKDYYAKKPGLSEIMTVLEGNPLGTGGAIKNAGPTVKSNPFLVANGDSFCSIDYRDLVRFHYEKKALYTVAVVKIKENQDGGLVSLDSQDRVTGFNEKTESRGAGYVNAGVYLLDKEVLNVIKSGEKVSMEYDVFPKLTGRGFYGYPVDGGLTDIGTPERYRKAQELLKNVT